MHKNWIYVRFLDLTVSKILKYWSKIITKKFWWDLWFSHSLSLDVPCSLCGTLAWSLCDPCWFELKRWWLGGPVCPLKECWREVSDWRLGLIRKLSCFSWLLFCSLSFEFLKDLSPCWNELEKSIAPLELLLPPERWDPSGHSQLK